MNTHLIIAIMGPTASGKSNFALDLAEKVNGEIVCVDSTTVYRGLNIGSSKPTAADRQRVPHHLLDLLEPSEPFSAFHFVKLAEETIADIESRAKIPVLVGGTYFYFRALQHGMFNLPPIPDQVFEELEKEFFEDERLDTQKMHAELEKRDPKAAGAIHPNDRYRVLRALAIVRSTGQLPSELKPTPVGSPDKKRLWLKYAMTLSRGDLNQRIQMRAEKMIASGLVEETKAIWQKSPSARALGAIGYHEAVQLLERKLTDKQLRNEIIEKTRQLAKRQLTWLRSDAEIRFVDARDVDRVTLEVTNLQFALGETA